MKITLLMAIILGSRLNGLPRTGCIMGQPDGIYAIDPTSGEMSRISWINVYRDQEGYENHATSEFATDLLIAH